MGQIAMIRKKFDQDLHDNYGKPAEIVVAKYLATLPWVEEVIHLPEGEMGVDFKIIEKDGEVSYADAERRSNWKSWDYEFTFPTIHIAMRKEHFMRECLPFTLCIVRDDMKRVLFIDGKDILRWDKIKKPNKYVPSGKEEFFNVPIKSVNIRYGDLE